MKIATISLNQVWENKEENKNRCLSFIIKAFEDKCDIIIFPEMTLTGFSMNPDKIKEKLDNSDTIRWFVEMAVYYKINIVFGMVLGGREKAKNVAIVVSKEGEILCNYTKIHPFSYADENKYFEGGDRLGIFKIDGIKIGLTICYDLRFPELYQSLSKEAYVIINIANWPQRRSEHWNILSTARAIENQVFMVSVNRIGVDGNDTTYIKGSKVINPSGVILDPANSDGEEMDIYDFDPRTVEFIRESFPVKKDRKIDFYKKNL